MALSGSPGTRPVSWTRAHSQALRLFCLPLIPMSRHAPLLAPPSTTQILWLDHFIAYALYHTWLHASMTFAVLYLLQRLRVCFPAAKGSSSHCLFISAFMLASKIICNDTYSNKSWCIVGPYPLMVLPQPAPAPPHTVTHIHDICHALPPPTSQGLFPRCEGVFRPLLIYFSLYAYLKDYLQ